jgi:hypothetical protein
MTHAELIERISSQELNEWMAFAQLEPFGTDAYYLGHAIVASTVANANRGKNTKAYKVSDFMPQFEKKEQSIDEMKNFAATMTMAMGGRVDLHEENDDG